MVRPLIVKWFSHLGTMRSWVGFLVCRINPQWEPCRSLPIGDIPLSVSISLSFSLLLLSKNHLKACKIFKNKPLDFENVIHFIYKDNDWVFSTT